MSSGAASHKSNSVKPNTNQNGLINADPGDIPTEVDFSRDDQDVTPVNPAAMERPAHSPQEDHQHESANENRNTIADSNEA